MTESISPKVQASTCGAFVCDTCGWLVIFLARLCSSHNCSNIKADWTTPHTHTLIVMLEKQSFPCQRWHIAPSPFYLFFSLSHCTELEGEKLCLVLVGLYNFKASGSGIKGKCIIPLVFLLSTAVCLIACTLHSLWFGSSGSRLLQREPTSLPPMGSSSQGDLQLPSYNSASARANSNFLLLFLCLYS